MQAVVGIAEGLRGALSVLLEPTLQGDRRGVSGNKWDLGKVAGGESERVRICGQILQNLL